MKMKLKSEPILVVLGFAGFVACARGGGDIDSIDPYIDGPIDGVTVPDSGLGGDGSIGDGGSTDAGTDAGPMGDPFPVGAISFFDRACPVGWTSYATLAGRTVVPTNGGAPLVAVGNPYSPLESRTHTHGVSLTFDLASVSYILATGGLNAGVGAQQQVTASAASAAVSATVPYVQMMACRKTAAPITGTIPTGLSAYFQAATCPTTWAQVANSKGRILIGTPNGGATGVTFGSANPLTDGEMRTHTHAVTGTWTPAYHGIAGVSGCCGGGYASAQGYPYNTTSSADDATPPYLALTHCRKN